MSDYNVLTYAIKEVGEETDTPRCISRVKSVYEHIKNKEREARTEKIETKKPPISMNEVIEGIKNDMEHGERPSLGVISEENIQNNNEIEK